jgi:hypothetical protein
MSLVYWLQAPGGTLLDISGKCRLYKFDMKENAEEGSVAVNSLTIDDPGGDLEMYGHRVLAVEETTAESSNHRFVFVGFVGVVKTVRGPYRTGVSRQYQAEVSDSNTLFARRILVGPDNDRPAETDNVRVAWVESTASGSNATIGDTRYLTTSNAISMDANDYLLQEELSVYDDCAQQSGKNYFLTYFGDTGVTAAAPWGSFSLFYDFAEASNIYLSAARLTNVFADINLTSATPTFYIGVEDTTQLTRDPMRVYSFVTVPYKNGYVTATRPGTETTFARRDKAMPAVNISTAGTAQARANRYVSDLQTPEDRATIKTVVPRSKVNVIRAGMLVQIKVRHWSGYQDQYTWMRVLSRRVVELTEGEESAFELTLELSRSVPGTPAGPVFCSLQASAGPYPANPGGVWFAHVGDSPGAGWTLEPTKGLVSAVVDPLPPKAGRPYSGIKILGTGTVDISLFLTTVGVLGGATTVTASITKNGAVVKSEAHVPAWSHGLQGWTDSFTVTTTGLSVVPNDIIAATIGFTGSNIYFFRTPAGTGQNGESLKITGGSLA